VEFRQHYSGSTGNLYTIDYNGEKLLIEAGVTIDRIRKATNFSLHEYCGCLITHEHKDHCKAVMDIAMAGVQVYTSEGTMVTMNKGKCLPYVRIEALRAFSIGSFTILPFEIEHDAQEPLGFLIQAGKDKLLFATDTYFVRYRFPGLTQIAIECNWSEESLSGDIDKAHEDRLRRSHLSLERLKKMLSANDLSNVREIHLLHVSRSNGNKDMFIDEIETLTGIPVYCVDEKRGWR